jgi:hypothetical protein
MSDDAFPAELEDLARQLWLRVRADMCRGARYYHERLDEDEAMHVVRSTVWYTHEKYPDLQGDEFLKQARKVCVQFSEYLSKAMDQKRQRRNRITIARNCGDKHPALPWGEEFTPREYPDGPETYGIPCGASLTDTEYDHREYEAKVAEIDVVDVTTRLAGHLHSDAAALAWVLHKGYGWSCPQILEVWGLSEAALYEQGCANPAVDAAFDRIAEKHPELAGEEILQRAAHNVYGATRKRLWEQIGQITQEAKAALTDEAEGLAQFFVNAAVPLPACPATI